MVDEKSSIYWKEFQMYTIYLRALDGRYLNISFVTVKFFPPYGRIIFSDRPNASSPTITCGIGSAFNVEISFGSGIFKAFYIIFL